ncbi:hypothetical protein [Solidesulfovibrio magneticus]|uniref:LysM domain-containing protein n=1 Tax=Solidesulfovibrio magneticus (strain ATCC 700980 / DSM 13731 / RS-1) TaxID=573370 RepID=C4XMM5_SOLM1|nr:hypothetical protein [Solidesulfovibrio magneticus]BAH74816.1 hypothetical protein DMR_13250 [Solidesulfovibrio magneticus RS-1]
MSNTLAQLLSAVVCLLPNLLFAAAQPAPPPARTDDHHASSPITELGDTLVSIARRLGLTSQPLDKANAPEQTDKAVAGNMLRLPVTPPETNRTAPAPAATPPAAAQSAAPLQPKPPVPLPTLVQPPAKADAATDTNAAKPGIVPPPATAEPAPAKAADATGDAARLAVGAYANPTLGVLRVTQAPTGIAVGRDNRTIVMRHLLYGVFDGTDATGDIQGLRLQFDDDGQVRALLYSSSSGKDIPFTRMKK